MTLDPELQRPVGYFNNVAYSIDHYVHGGATCRIANNQRSGSRQGGLRPRRKMITGSGIKFGADRYRLRHGLPSGIEAIDAERQGRTVLLTEL